MSQDYWSRGHCRNLLKSSPMGSIPTGASHTTKVSGVGLGLQSHPWSHVCRVSLQGPSGCSPPGRGNTTFAELSLGG